MSKTNCINCGGAKDITEIVCPFCGTAYFDMAEIDLDGRTPCILRLKLPGTENKTFTMKAYPSMANLTIEPGCICMRDSAGFLHRTNFGTNYIAEIKFISAR